ncbi:MAG: heavy metal-binding domain-containing protein [Thermoplasmatota archaeon]
MKEKASPILTNLDRVPGRRIMDTLGMVYGYASVRKNGKGKPVLKLEGEEIGWLETAENIEALLREAEAQLARSGMEMGSDAVVKLEGKLTRNDQGLPEMLLMGTAVKLDPAGDEETVPVEGGEEEDKAEVSREEGDSITFQIDGEEVNWKPPQATTPRIEALKKMRERGVKEIRSYDEDRGSILTLAQDIGIPLERAKLLIENGFDKLSKIAGASTKEITVVEGINPTQARIIRQKARDMLAED